MKQFLNWIKKKYEVVDNIDTNINCMKTKMEEIAQNEKHENLVLEMENFF